jgi:hypothetical protein
VKGLRRGTGVLAIMVMGLGLLLAPHVAQAAPAGLDAVGLRVTTAATSQARDVRSQFATC